MILFFIFFFYFFCLMKQNLSQIKTSIFLASNTLKVLTLQTINREYKSTHGICAEKRYTTPAPLFSRLFFQIENRRVIIQVNAIKIIGVEFTYHRAHARRVYTLSLSRVSFFSTGA